MREILNRLRARYSIDLDSYVAPRAIRARANPFEVLVGIVLSQNTSDKNAIKAFESLRAMLGGSITPEALERADVGEIANAIRVAGQQYRRAKILKDLAKAFISNPNIVSELAQAPTEEARAKLLALPGVGPKTADVFLLMYLRKRTFPIDTHISRIAKRLGLGSSYEEIRRNVLRLGKDLSVEELIELHLLLIQHGRETCRPRAPLCDQCVLRDLCLYARSRL